MSFVIFIYIFHFNNISRKPAISANCDFVEFFLEEDRNSRRDTNMKTFLVVVCCIFYCQAGTIKGPDTVINDKPETIPDVTTEVTRTNSKNGPSIEVGKPTRSVPLAPVEHSTENPAETTIRNSTQEIIPGPIEKPTENPTETPNGKTTGKPAEKPTDKPTEKPTEKPKVLPTTSVEPVHPTSLTPADNTTTAKPTDKPTTTKPTDKPTTTKPTDKPTTTKPTDKPTTTKPTDKPTTSTPTDKPTSIKPTPAPTVEPSPQPIVSTTPAAVPANRGFDGPSFIGGIVLASGLMAIGFVALKFYRARTELNYHTL